MFKPCGIKSVTKAIVDIGLKCLPLLGCQERYTFVLDENESQACSCVLDLLRAMHLKSPVEQLILSGTEAHHKQYHCGTKTLLAMTVLFIQAADHLMTQGIPVEEVISGFHKGLQYCIQNLKLIDIKKLLEESAVDNKLKEANLKMEKLQLKEEEDLDDISWYFDDSSREPLAVPNDNVVTDFTAVFTRHGTAGNECYSSLKENDDNYDEFDDCFASTEPTSVASQHHSSSSSAAEVAVSSQTDLETKLQKILAAKSNSRMVNMLNRSRHFRTVQSAAADLSLTKEPTEKVQCDGLNDVIPETSENYINVLKSTSSDTSTTLNIHQHTASPVSLVEPKSRSGFQRFHSDEIDKSLPDTEKTGSRSHDNTENLWCHSEDMNVLVEDHFIQSFLSQSASEVTNGRVRVTAFTNLVRGVCHNSALVPVVTELLHHQNRDRYQDSLRFDKEKIYCCQCSHQSPIKSKVVAGVVVKTTQRQLELLSMCSLHSHTALFVNGDLTPSYKHQGYKGTLEGRRVTSKLSDLTTAQHWIDNALHVIKQHSLTVIFVKGHVFEDLELALGGLGILVISQVPGKVLHALSSACDADMLQYIADCSQFNVASGIKMLPWQPDWMDKVTETMSPSYLVIQPVSPGAMTAVLCSWNEELADMMEESLWHCVYRLDHIVKQGHALAGSGITEYCMSQLLKQHPAGQQLFQKEICDALAQVFLRYFHTVHINNGNKVRNVTDILQIGTEYYLYLDDYISKVQAWNNSLNIVSHLLYIDMEIITNKAL